MPVETGKPFHTTSLVEATLMFMTKGRVQCKWRGRGMCNFTFHECTQEEIAFACDAQTTVVAREFNHAMSQLKDEMYAARDGG